MRHDLPFTHSFPLSYASPALRTGTVKPCHARRHPGASSVSYDNAVNTRGAGCCPPGAGAGLLRSYGEGVFTVVFGLSVLPPGQLGCLGVQQPGNAVRGVNGNSVWPTPAGHGEETRRGDRVLEAPLGPPPLGPPRAAARPWMQSQALLLQAGFLTQILRYAANGVFSTWAPCFLPSPLLVGACP